MAVITTQAARNSPKPTMACHFPNKNGIRNPRTRLTPNAHLKVTASSGRLVCFQRASGPTPMRDSAGARSGTNTGSKYGGAKGNFAAPGAALADGKNKPRKTMGAAGTSKTQLADGNAS